MSHPLCYASRISLLLILCSLLHAQPLPVIQEETQLIDHRIPGILCYPKPIRSQASALPAVLLLHGFGSHKNEVGDLYKKLAHQLAEKGVASLRIDFTGWGDSTAPMESSNLYNMLSDAEKGYQFLRTNSMINPKKIAIGGFSLGAYIGFELAQQKQATALIMLSPVGNPAIDFKRSLGNLALAHKTEKNTFNLGWRTVSLGKSFFESLLSSRSLAQLGPLSMPILAIAAEEDASYQYLSVINAASSSNNVMISLKNSDHIFGIHSVHDHSALIIDFVSDWVSERIE